MEIVKALVLSDTHLPSRAQRLPEPVLAALGEADLILHAGDLATAAVLDELRQYAPVTSVYGNVDDEEVRRTLPRRTIVDVGAFRVGLVHGHGATGTTLERATAAFANDAVDCVVFGHSHRPLCERRNGRLFLNPGSPTDLRTQPKRSFAWLCAGDSLDA
ncbi:MAG: metallophosphoesterase family protein, partial [Chloroflexota bacterium]